MFSTLLKLAFLAAPALADFAISQPKFTQCKSADISWEKTNGPYNLIIVNATNPCGDSVADLGDHDGTKISWKVALPAGFQVQLSLEDKNGDEAWSGTIEVEDSDDTSCIPASLKVAIPNGNGNPASVPPAGSVPPPTVVVTPTFTVGVGASSTPGAGPSAVGAANAGVDPLGLDNGAPSLRQASTPIMVLGAIAAVVVAAL